MRSKQLNIFLISVVVFLQFVILAFFWMSDYLIVEPILSIIIYTLPFFNLTLLLFAFVFISARKEKKIESGGFKTFILLLVAVFSLMPFSFSVILSSLNPIITKYTYKNKEGIYLYINHIANEWGEKEQENHTLYLSESNSKWLRKIKLIDNDIKHEILNQHFNKSDKIIYEGSIYLSE